MNDALTRRVLDQPGGVYRWPARLTRSRLTGAAGERGWRVVSVHGRSVSNKAEFLARCEQAFAFPSYFGRNWDALDECLIDLQAAPGFLVLMSGMGAFAEQAPGDWEVARSILGAAAEWWAQRAVPFIVLVRGAADTEPLNWFSREP